MAVISLFLLWFAIAGATAWRLAPLGVSSVHLALGRAASIVIVLPFLHSIVDYPLRTAALAVMFAIACGPINPNEEKQGAVTWRLRISAGQDQASGYVGSIVSVTT